jgi:RNA polymerase sigma factor (sigma-70 family)
VSAPLPGSGLDQLVRRHWWAAVATLCRLTGDLGAAEDAVQEACVAALERWPSAGVPDNALGWLIGVARHKALDRLRREAIRGTKEAASMREANQQSAGQDASPRAADTLSLMFLCCHPALDVSARVALTLRAVCGLSTAEIAAAFLVPEATMAKRLVRAKAKIREAHIPFRVPGEAELPDRLGAVLRVVYLLFTEGHMASRGDALVRGDLCDTVIWMARGVVGLLRGEPEAMGLPGQRGGIRRRLRPHPGRRRHLLRRPRLPATRPDLPQPRPPGHVLPRPQRPPHGDPHPGRLTAVRKRARAPVRARFHAAAWASARIAGMLADVEPRVSSPVLVGRSGQLSALDTALAEASRGRPSAVMIGGEAGVGKSRLVSEFAERSRGMGARVLTGGCLELGAEGLPFAPFTAVLREVVRDLGVARIAELMPAGATRELARLLPELGEPGNR